MMPNTFASLFLRWVFQELITPNAVRMGEGRRVAASLLRDDPVAALILLSIFNGGSAEDCLKPVIEARLELLEKMSLVARGEGGERRLTERGRMVAEELLKSVNPAPPERYPA